MNRLTGKRIDGSYIVADEDMGKAIERLGVFEDAYESLVRDLEQIPKDLEALRVQGKEKTIRYKEAVTQKLINNNIMFFFERHDLK